VRTARTILGLSLTGATFWTLTAQPPKSVADGVFSDAQAQRGAGVYKTQCASCHGDDLSGQGQTPPLSGDDFKANWNGQTVDDLFEEIQASMPGNHPGSLTREQNADIIAFLLKSNQFPAGKSDLPSEAAALKQIKFEAAKK
jgi:mono/diheme cytochrome c family protein